MYLEFSLLELLLPYVAAVKQQGSVVADKPRGNSRSITLGKLIHKEVCIYYNGFLCKDPCVDDIIYRSLAELV